MLHHVTSMQWPMQTYVHPRGVSEGKFQIIAEYESESKYRIRQNLCFLATCFVHSGLHLGGLVQCCEENAFGDCRRCEQLGNQLPVRAAAHRLIFPIFPSQDVMHAASQLLVLCGALTHVQSSAIHASKMRHCLLGQHRDGPALSAMLFHVVPATAFNAVCARVSVLYACGASFFCSQPPPAGASALLVAREKCVCVCEACCDSADLRGWPAPTRP